MIHLKHYHDYSWRAVSLYFDHSAVLTNSLLGMKSVSHQSPWQCDSKATGSSCSAVDLQYLLPPSLILSVLTVCGHGRLSLFPQKPGFTVNRAGAVELNANMPQTTTNINITKAVEKIAHILTTGCHVTDITRLRRVSAI